MSESGGDLKSNPTNTCLLAFTTVVPAEVAVVAFMPQDSNICSLQSKVMFNEFESSIPSLSSKNRSTIIIIQHQQVKSKTGVVGGGLPGPTMAKLGDGVVG